MGLVLGSAQLAQRLSMMFDTASPALAYRGTLGADDRAAMARRCRRDIARRARKNLGTHRMKARILSLSATESLP